MKQEQQPPSYDEGMLQQIANAPAYPEPQRQGNYENIA